MKGARAGEVGVGCHRETDGIVERAERGIVFKVQNNFVAGSGGLKTGRQKWKKRRWRERCKTRQKTTMPAAR